LHRVAQTVPMSDDALPLQRDERPWTLWFLLLPIALLHVLGWSRHPSDVDPINFVAALTKWDLAGDAPHPPGYPLYVGAAKTIAALMPGISAYQTLNLLLLFATGVLLYLILRPHDRLAALAAAGLLATHPLAWAATVTSECYVSDALAATAVLAFALRSRRMSGKTAFVAMFFVYFFCSMVRPVSVALLLPLGVVAAAYTAARFDRLRALIIASAAACAFAVGYLCTVQLAGGMDAYRFAVTRVMGAAVRENSVLAGASVQAHGAMLGKMLVWFVLLATPYAACWFYARRNGERPPGSTHEARWIAAAWLLPVVGFYALVYYLKPTYHLIELPLLVMTGALGLSHLGRRFVPRWKLAPALLCMTLQVGYFWLAPKGLPKPLARLGHQSFSTIDRGWDSLERHLRNDRGPEVLVIYHSHPQLPFRALRLIMADQLQAVVQRGENGIGLYDPVSGRFVAQASRIDERVRRIVLLESKDEQALLFRYEFAHGDDRTVQNAIAAARARPVLRL
jgi:hypothetical protein